MTFPTVGSVAAPGILERRPAIAPAAPHRTAAIDFVRLFALDRLPRGTRLACHWQRYPDGRLACLWERELSPLPRR